MQVIRNINKTEVRILASEIMDAFKEPSYEVKKLVSALAYYSNFDDHELNKAQLKRKPLVIAEAKKLLEVEKQLIKLAKTNAIGNFTSDGDSAEHYDQFLKQGFECGLTPWEPFEDYPEDEVQKLVQQEFSNLLALCKKAIEIATGGSKT